MTTEPANPKPRRRWWQFSLRTFFVLVSERSESLAVSRPGPLCPECSKPLATSEAQQCFHCGSDWHQRTTDKANMKEDQA
ncbi:MAG: hypothetical protein IH987_07050 [Planctomycetes bacterium]|nr:hypothetical protein [Planctomycetota bacterium]